MTSTATYPADGPIPYTSASSRIGADAILRVATLCGAVCILLMLAALLVVLFTAAIPSITTFGLSFLTGTEWRPNELETATGISPPVFGALPVIYGTVVSSALSLVFAVPLSFGAALFLVRAAPRWLKGPVSFLIEFLAAIPSLAYGIWGLFILAPFLQTYVEPALQKMLEPLPGTQWLFQTQIVVGTLTFQRPLPLSGKDMFCGSLVLGIMIIPIITAISRDVLQQVPRAQIEGSVALGATWWQSCKEMLKYSRSGLFGAVMLGLARAAGETMAVTMVIGNNNQIVPSPFAPAQTMSSLLASQFAEATSKLHVAALSEVALILLLMSLAFNIVARWLVVGKGSRSAAAH